MKQRGCGNSHFIWSIKDGDMRKVHNTDSQGRPGLKFKELDDILQCADGEYTSLAFAKRKPRERSGFVAERDEPDFLSDETDSQGRQDLKFKKLDDILQTAESEYTPSVFAERKNRARVATDVEEMTLSQLLKKCKSKKRKASEPLRLTSKEEEDDIDLSEPLFKLRKVSKRSPSKKSTDVNDLVIVEVKAEALEEEYFDCSEGSDLFECTESSMFAVSEDEVNNTGSGSVANEGEIAGVSEVSLDDLENMDLMDEEIMPNDLLALSEGLNCSQSQLNLQQTPEKVSDVSDSQESDLAIRDGNFHTDISDEGSPRNRDSGSPSFAPDLLCLPSKSHSWPNCDDLDDDEMVPADSGSPIPEEKQHSTPVKITDADSNSMNSDDSCVAIAQEQSSFVPENVDSEMDFSDHNHQTDFTSEAAEIRNSDCIETRQPERLPLTRKSISPNSQEKLCQAVKSAELPDDMDLFKCKEKLYFEEPSGNAFSSTKSDVAENKPIVHPQRATPIGQNRVYISPRQLLQRPKISKKDSTPTSVAPKSCLDGPRQCRSLPRLSTGCTSIQGCSQNAIAFSQRQMQDIESLASKLISELNSIRVIAEEKVLYEAYRSPSLKNEADEVKSAIKSATKTEETAKKWLSMMSRDCNRFCKIMKLNEDKNSFAAADTALESTNVEKPVQRERKKISFADEAGGTLCDVKVFHIEQDSLELNEKPSNITNL